MRYGVLGVIGADIRERLMNWKGLERPGEEGDTPVQVSWLIRVCHLSRAGHVESCLNLRRPRRKAKYDRKTDSVPVP